LDEKYHIELEQIELVALLLGISDLIIINVDYYNKLKNTGELTEEIKEACLTQLEILEGLSKKLSPILLDRPHPTTGTTEITPHPEW